jgi:microcystin-dependent protein
MNNSIRRTGWLNTLAKWMRPGTTSRTRTAIRLGSELLEDRLVPDSTGSVGGGVPLDITAPSLPVHYIICVAGVFPTRGDSVDGAGGEPFLGEVLLYASDTQTDPGEPMPGWDYCDGQVLPINQNEALFSILGKTYGGNGTTTFALPDLRGRAPVDVGQTAGGPFIVDGKQAGTETDALTLNQIPNHDAPLPAGGSTSSVGGNKPISLDMPRLGINYIIAEGGIVSSIGEIRLFAGNFAPDGWVFCSGQILSISKFPALYSVIGNTYGGNGKTTFALPNLQGRMMVGSGTDPLDPALGAHLGSAATTLTVAQLPIHNYPLPGGGTTGNVGSGQLVDTTEPSLGINYIISLYGGYQSVSEDTPAVGQIEPFAGTVVPSGWLLCDGSLQQISDYAALFSLLGTTYGGDGVTTFALPNLVGRVPVEAGQGTNLTDRIIGQPFGGGTVSVANMPAESLTLPVVTVDVKADHSSVTHGAQAGFTLTISNTGAGTVAGGVTLSDPLPDLGSGNTWSIDGGVNAKSFTISGTSGNQQLNLAPNITSLKGGTTLVVHIAGITSATGSFSSATLTDTAIVDSPDETIQNQSSSASVVVIHTAPVLSKIEATLLSYHAGIPIDITSTITVSDSDSPTLAGATISISKGLAPTEDTLAFTDQNGITGSYDKSSGMLTLSGSASVADYQAALRSVTYQDTSLTPSTAARTITIVVSDGALNHNLSTLVARKIAVAAHLAPVLSKIEPATLLYKAGETVNVTDSLTVADSDSSTLVEATISFAPGFNAIEDELDFTSIDGITSSYVSTTGVLTLTGVASIADYQAALRSVTYTDESADPTASFRTLIFQVSDGFGINSTSKSVSRKISV